jgi:hypothetical protein
MTPTKHPGMAVSYKSGDRFRPSVAIMLLGVSITHPHWPEGCE